MEIDFDKVSSLLAVIEKVTTVAPRATNIIAEAMAQINVINDDLVKKHHEQRVADEKAAAAKRDKQASEAKLQAEAEAKASAPPANPLVKDPKPSEPVTPVPVKDPPKDPPTPPSGTSPDMSSVKRI